MIIDKLFAGLNISGQGLTAQRKRMNAIANNIANAETTRTENGSPYRRKTVSVQSSTDNQFVQQFQNAPPVVLNASRPDHIGAPSLQSGFGENPPASIEAVESEDTSDFKLAHDPTHPDADENGYVKMPNVNIVTEMVDMMSATRAYEANITVVNAQKQMAKDTLEI